MRKTIAVFLCLGVTIGMLAGCGSRAGSTESIEHAADTGQAAAGTNTEPAGSSDSRKTMVIGDTTFNSENWEETVNPHETYNGWACIRYGVGETLVHYSDTMELEPWLAKSWENDGDCTWTIILQDEVTFSSGRKMDGEAVKQCLDHLLEVHDRAPLDTKIVDIQADGQVLTITTSEPNPALMNYLGDPYGCIIDVDASDFESGIVAGTGPYVVKELVTDDHLTLTKNENYWNGTPKIDELTIRTLSNGDTLSAALQSGDIDAAYGMAYEAYPNFENDNYQFSSVQTSRAFFCSMNMTSPVIQDDAVRKAIAMSIDKEGFVTALLDGHGVAANGAFPNGFAGFGGEHVKTESYNSEGAKVVLEEAGWTDSDGDGIREKDGQKLTIKWLTYPSRQELPLLAESAQSTLKDIGMDVQINATADHNSIWKDASAWDVYVGANVNCGLGDPTNFFSTHCLDASTKNRGQYHSDKLEELAVQLNSTFDKTERNQIAIEMQQQLLDDNAFVFCSFLKMSMISQANVSGLTAHASDYYELTADLDIN